MNSKKIAVLCPTRGRPENANLVLKSYNETSHSNSDIFFILDSDDFHNYNSIKDKYFNKIIFKKVGSNHGVVGPVNYAAMMLCKKYDYLYFMGDDHRFVSEDWEEHFIHSMDLLGGIGVVYPNDLLQGCLLASSHLVSSNIVSTLGHFYNPIFTHLCTDNSIMHIGNSINKIKYLENIVIEHMHPFAGKSKWDDLYKHVNSDEMNKKDRDSWNLWLSSISLEEISTLKNRFKL